jgi:dipeptidyl aminopeptidase/acylaminoacyl peptidase
VRLSVSLLYPVLLLCWSASLSASPRPMTHEDMWLMPRMSAPVLSPDGRRIAVPIIEASYEGKDQADLWLIDADKGGGHRITFHPGPESHPAWSPDGNKLAFVARREGDAAGQIYLLDLAKGGEARRLTDQVGGARTPQFSPDGSQILFQSEVHAGTRSEQENRDRAAELAARKYRVRTFDGFPIRRWNRWLDERQTRLLTVPSDGGPARDLLATTALVDEPGFAARSELSSGTLDPVFSPDGQQIVFVASTNAHTAAFRFTHLDLYVLALADGKLRRLTGMDDDRGDSYSRPRFSADGKSLYAQVTPRSDKVYNATRIDQFSWPDGKYQGRLSAPDDYAIDEFAPASTGSGLWYLSERAGHVDLHQLRPGASVGRVMRRLDKGMYSNLQVGGGRDQVLIAVYQSSTEPPELVRIDPRDGSHRPLTEIAAGRAAALDLAEPEHFWFDNARGVPIHSMLIKPAGFDPSRKYPLLVLMHGGPHSMWRDFYFVRWNYHLLAGTEYVLLLTNYSGSTGFGEAFAQAIHGDPFAGPAAEINQAADVAIARFPFIDGQRQCAGGASYGGHLANWMQGTTNRYRCLISHAGLVNLEAQWGTSDVIYGREVTAGGPVWEQSGVWIEQNPARLAANFSTPTLVSVGEKDYRVPMNNVLEYWSLLQRQQVPSRLLVYPNEDHWIQNGANSRHYYGEISQWLKRWLE